MKIITKKNLSIKKITKREPINKKKSQKLILNSTQSSSVQNQSENVYHFNQHLIIILINVDYHCN